MRPEYATRDDDLLEAVRLAEAEAINGLPHADNIAKESTLSVSQVKRRLHQLERDGQVKTYKSLTPGHGGEVLTAEVSDE